MSSWGGGHDDLDRELMRVLLVEDGREFAAELQERLAAFKCEVTWATTAQDCFEAATGEPPHIILVSATLGAISGLNICNGLKRDPKLRRIHLVIMTSAPIVELASHMALPTRADAYVNKDADEVMEQVRNVMEARWDKGALIGRAPPPSTQRATTLDPPSELMDSADFSLPEAGEDRRLVDLVMETPREAPGDIELITQQSIPVPVLPTGNEEMEGRLAELAARLEVLAEVVTRQDERIATLERELAALADDT